jgi:hypothetical protein
LASCAQEGKKVNKDRLTVAWMTMEIFDSWLQKFNKQMKLQNQKILLLIDKTLLLLS